MGLAVSGADGRGGVVRSLVGAASAEFEGARAAAIGEQASLFPVPTRFHGPRGDALQRSTERRAGPGRPDGAENLTTKAFRGWLLRRGVSPLASLMRYAILPPDLLAEELKCTRLEAFREWRILQSELAPYLHGKVGFVDDDGKPLPFLVMNVAGREVQIASGMTPWQMREKLAAELKGNQTLTVEAATQSHAAQSHGDGK